MTRKYTLRFRIGKRFGKGSSYSLRDIAISIVDRWSLTDNEFNRIVNMVVGEDYTVLDIHIRRIR